MLGVHETCKAAAAAAAAAAGGAVQSKLSSENGVSDIAFGSSRLLQ
jgi:hypothetical protein